MPRPQRQTAIGQPYRAIARFRPVLIQEIYQICNIKRIHNAIAIGIAGTEGVRFRCSSVLIQKINYISDIKGVENAVVVGIARFTQTACAAKFVWIAVNSSGSPRNIVLPRITAIGWIIAPTVAGIIGIIPETTHDVIYGI